MPERPGTSSPAADIAELLRACLAALRVPERQAAAFRVRPPPFWRVPQAIERIERLLPELPDRSPLSAFLPRIAAGGLDHERRCRAAVASTLVGGLELARGGGIVLGQGAPWAPIEVARPAAPRRGHGAGPG